MPVQVNGKLRGRIMVAADADKAAIEAAARADEKSPNCSAGQWSQRLSRAGKDGELRCEVRPFTRPLPGRH